MGGDTGLANASVSVVVPVRDRCCLIAEAVDSALGQSRPPLEVIVVDDGSTDGTAELLAHRYGDAIRVERFDRTRGCSAARNRGVSVARGDLVAFLDSDDVWLTHKLKCQVPLFQDEALSLVFGRIEMIDSESHLLPESSTQFEQLFDQQQQRGVDYAGLTEPWCAMRTSTVVVRRLALDRARGFDESLAHYEDWDLFWRIILEGKACAFAETVAGYRVHSGNSDHDVHRAAAAWLAVNRKHMALVAGIPNLARRRRALRNLALNLAIGELWRGDRAASRRLVAQTFWTDPGVVRLRDHPVWGEALRAATHRPRRPLRLRMTDPVPHDEASTPPSGPPPPEVPTMTVVIISYERRRRLALLLDGLATEFRRHPETGIGLDVVVVLDGSTDGSRQLLDDLEYPVPLRGIWQSNRGRAAARNVGIRAATGEIVLFLDDDGVPEPGLIATHRRGHVLGEEEVVVGSCEVVGPASVLPVLVDHSRRHHGQLVRCRNAVTASQVTFANSSVARRVLLALGGFDEAFVGWGAEDGELGARLLEHGVRVRYDPAAVVRHEPGMGPRGFVRSRIELGRNTALLLDRHPDLVDAYLAPTSPALPTVIGSPHGSRPRALQALGATVLAAGRALHPIAPDLGLGLMWLSWDILVASGLLAADRSGRWFERFVAGARPH